MLEVSCSALTPESVLVYARTHQPIQIVDEQQVRARDSNNLQCSMYWRLYVSVMLPGATLSTHANIKNIYPSQDVWPCGEIH